MIQVISSQCLSEKPRPGYVRKLFWPFQFTSTTNSGQEGVTQNHCSQLSSGRVAFGVGQYSPSPSKLSSLQLHHPVSALRLQQSELPFLVPNDQVTTTDIPLGVLPVTEHVSVFPRPPPSPPPAISSVSYHPVITPWPRDSEGAPP